MPSLKFRDPVDLQYGDIVAPVGRASLKWRVMYLSGGELDMMMMSLSEPLTAPGGYYDIGKPFLWASSSRYWEKVNEGD